VRGDDIIDVDVDPRAARRQFWRRFVRFGVPLAGVVLIVGAIIAITFYSYRSNRSDALGLSQNLIAALDQRVAAEVAGYLEPAAQAVRTLAGLVPEQGLAPSGRPRLEQLMIALLRDRPQLASLYVGDPQGSFLMVQRSAAGTMDTKLIEQNGEQRRVTWRRRDEAGQIETVEDPTDTFDPRTRPWYEGASAAEGLFWTDVYVFFTDREPGLTASSARHDPERGIVAVAGGDITLTALSEFLASLEIGASGRAMIIDAQGRLVAFPDPAAVVEATTEGEFQPAQIDAIGEPVLAEAYYRVRVAGAGRSIVEIDDQRASNAGCGKATRASPEKPLIQPLSRLPMAPASRASRMRARTSFGTSIARIRPRNTVRVRLLRPVLRWRSRASAITKPVSRWRPSNTSSIVRRLWRGSRPCCSRSSNGMPGASPAPCCSSPAAWQIAGMTRSRTR
jgi:adenylate cyclase